MAPPLALEGQGLRTAAWAPAQQRIRTPIVLGRPTPCPKLLGNIKQLVAPSHALGIRTTGSSAASRCASIIPLTPKDEALLSSHGINTVEDLETIHFDLHLSSAGATRLFLKDVVGLKNETAVHSIMDFLGADDLEPYSGSDASRPASASHVEHVDSIDSTVQQYQSTGTSSRHSSISPPRIVGVSAAPTRSTPTLPQRNTSRLSPAPLMPASTPQPTLVPAASRYSGGSAVAVDDRASLEELARFEKPVLDLLQNYSGLTLERLDGLLYMSGKEPKFTQGIARLQLLLDAMVSQGTVRFEDGMYRYQSRTSKSPPAGRSGSTSNDSSASNSRSSVRPASARSPGSRAPAPRPVAEVIDLSSYESRILDVLMKYEGLPLERLNNMLSMSPGTPRYEAAPEQLEPFLNTLIRQGKVSLDKHMYRANAYTPSQYRRAASPSGSRARSPAPAPPMAEIGYYEPAVLDLLQNYAGLTLERLDSLLSASPKADGYRSSPRLLASLLNRLISDGKLVQDGGLYRYRARSPTAARARSPSGSRSASAPLSPAPLNSRRKPSGPAPSPQPRMADIAFYESAVLNLLQNYAGLSLERLDSLLCANPRAVGYVSSPSALQSLLTVLQSQGRIVNENGLYRYRSSGKTPVGSRAKTPVGSGRTTPAIRNTPRAASPTASTGSEDWSVYENTIMSMLGNYGALPMDRLHDALKMSMVWPRYDRTPAQLSSFLTSLVVAGKLVQDNGLYRLPGSGGVVRVAGTPYSSTPQDVARFEGQVLSTLASYPGLTVERLNNMLKLSKTAAADLDEDSLSILMSSLLSQGKVTTENGLYKVVTASRDTTPSSSAATGVAPAYQGPGALSASQLALLDGVGFPTQDGVSGFTPFSEVWNGRWAMLGILASIVIELRTGSGTLEQLGLVNLPSMDLFNLIVNGTLVLVVSSAVFTGYRWAQGLMDDKEKQRYLRLLAGKPQDVELADKFYTDELRYARNAEVANGRAAMIGFLFGIAMEALTGRGIVGQVALYLKLVGLLGEDSGF